MGTLSHRRSTFAPAIIALAAIAAYSIADSSSPAVTTIDEPLATTETVDAEVLSKVELATAQLRQIDVDATGFVGDIDVDLPTIDPGVLAIAPFTDDDDVDVRVKYIAATDELVFGLRGVAANTSLMIDIDNDGTYDAAVDQLPSNAPDYVFSVPTFSAIPGSDDSLDFGLSVIDGAQDSNDVEPLIVALDATLGSTVFVDLDTDGSHDDDEPGASGVLATLLDETGSPIDEATTDSEGNYKFTVPPGTYAIEFTAPPGRSFVKRNAGDDRSNDSNAAQLTGRTSLVFVGPGDANLTLDAGLTP